MKAASPALISLMETGVFSTWDLYKISLSGGLVLNLTSADFDIRDTDGTLYSCGSSGSGLPRVDAKSARASADVKAGLDPDQWVVQIMPMVQDPFTGAFTYPDLVGGTPWLAACQAGLFDGANITVKRAYFGVLPSYPLTVVGQTCVGSTIEFAGYLGQIDANNTASIFTFTGWGGLLNQTMPRNLYQPSCRHQLFNALCGLSASAYSQNGVAQAGSSATTLIASVPAPGGSGTFNLGRIQFTGGKNSGFSRLITAWDGVETFNFMYPLPFAIEPGDTFTVLPGCDKTLGPQGCGGFANLLNFSGNPYVPLPEAVLG